MTIQDRRCIHCNWLNKEVSEKYICKNCGEDIQEELQIENNKEESEKDILQSSNRRNK